MSHSFDAKKKLRYPLLVALNLSHRKSAPGDTITLTLRNEETDEGIYAQAVRHLTMFVLSYSFYPTEIRLHPDHLSLLKRQGRRLDILVGEKVLPMLQAVLSDIGELPREVPLVGDGSLDLFTTVATYTWTSEEVENMAGEAVEYLIGHYS